MNRRKQYIISAATAVFLILALSTYKYLYQDPRNIAAEKAEFQLPASELNWALADEKQAPKYIDKVIQTHGRITAIEQQSVIIEDKVQVNFIKDNPNFPVVDDQIAIKGRCVGYDDLLELVKIDQAIVISNN